MYSTLHHIHVHVTKRLSNYGNHNMSIVYIMYNVHPLIFILPLSCFTNTHESTTVIEIASRIIVECIAQTLRKHSDYIHIQGNSQQWHILVQYMYVCIVYCTCTCVLCISYYNSCRIANCALEECTLCIYPHINRVNISCPKPKSSICWNRWTVCIIFTW